MCIIESRTLRPIMHTRALLIIAAILGCLGLWAYLAWFTPAYAESALPRLEQFRTRGYVDPLFDPGANASGVYAKLAVCNPARGSSYPCESWQQVEEQARALFERRRDARLFLAQQSPAGTRPAVNANTSQVSRDYRIPRFGTLPFNAKVSEVAEGMLLNHLPQGSGYHTFSAECFASPYRVEHKWSSGRVVVTEVERCEAGQRLVAIKPADLSDFLSGLVIVFTSKAMELRDAVRLIEPA